MATHGNTSRQKIKVSGLVAGGPESETAIILYDESGETLETACIEEDGSCELSEDAVAHARAIALAPIGLGIEVETFRSLLSPDGCLDIDALLGGERELPGDAGGGILWVRACKNPPQKKPPWD
jgi:hypothetical protein